MSNCLTEHITREQCHSGSWEVNLACLNSSSFSNLNQHENKPRPKGVGLRQPVLSCNQLAGCSSNTAASLGVSAKTTCCWNPQWGCPFMSGLDVISGTCCPAARLPGLLRCTGGHTPLPLLLLIMVLATECGEASHWGSDLLFSND